MRLGQRNCSDVVDGCTSMKLQVIMPKGLSRLDLLKKLTCHIVFSFLCVLCGKSRHLLLGLATPSPADGLARKTSSHRPLP